MDLNAALSMEALEMEKMKRRMSPSFVSNGKAASGTSSSRQLDQKDLISFLESPPPQPETSWSFFETNNSNTGTFTFGQQTFTNEFGLFASSQQQQNLWHQTHSGSLQSAMTHGMRRTGSGNFMAGFTTPPRRSGYEFVQPRTAQMPPSIPMASHANAFEDNFVPLSTKPVSVPAAFRSHADISRQQNSVKSCTPPGMSMPSSFFSNGPTRMEQPLNKSWDSGRFSKEIQEKDEEKLKADEINEVFQRWLDDSWNSCGSESDELIANSSDLPTTDPSSSAISWREWDPLVNSSSIEGTLTDSQQVSDNFVAKTEVVEPAEMRQEQLTQNKTLDSPQGGTSFGDTSIEQFINSVVQIHSTFPCNDPLSNPGYLVSPMMPRWQYASNGDKEVNTVKVSITTEESSQPVVFTCNICAVVEHVVSQALCIAHEDISQITTSDYRFRVHGRQEFLLSGTTLSLYEYVQDCLKLDEDVRLQLVHCNAVDKSLIRTVLDLNGEKLQLELKTLLKAPLTWNNVEVVKEAFFTEIERLVKHGAMSVYTPSQQCDRVHQSVKAVVQVLGGIETKDITHTMMKLRNVVEKTDWSNPVRKDIFNPDGSTIAKPTSAVLMSSDNSSQQDNIDKAVENLTNAVCSFIGMYCKAIDLESSHHNMTPNAISSNVQGLVTFNIVSVHRLPRLWSSMYEEFYISCQLLYGNHEIRQAVCTKSVKSIKIYKGRIIYDTWLTFPIKVGELPRETKLCLTLHGYPIGRDPNKGEKVIAKELAWVNAAVFDHRSVLHEGGTLYGMWSSTNVSAQMKASAMCSSNITSPESVVVCMQLLSSQQHKTILFPPFSIRLQLPRTVPNSASLSTLDEGTQQDLALILSKNPMMKLSDHEQDLLWKHRHIKEYVCSRGSLARILRSVPSWAPKNLSIVYQLLETWPRIDPIEAFELLSVSFPDVYVRKFAVRCIQSAEEDEIHDYLVQLTQALKYEMFHDGTLSKFLLRSALGSLRIAHKLYWLLSENSEAEPDSGAHCAVERYKIILTVLQTVSGARLKKEFDKEAYLVKMVNRAAGTVKYAKDSSRMSVLKVELERVAEKVKRHSFRLPTNPALVSNGIAVDDSSYFTSNAIPLKLAFNNTESDPKHFNLMFKLGDDLRQDVLTMQLVTIMDKLWLTEGLDLKMVTFACLSTGKDRGFIELVSDSITLREIQSSYGLTGAFKDRPIAEWLQKHNPTSASYEKAQENFTLSCAGYCVATYVLGICDRHNDNIMLRQSGHLFHIDFARFLGHAQMFGNIKRDRAPFVLTSDMAYVINGGDRPSSRFHDFVDICCRAFNIIRQNSHIFINLLSLMIHSGIPELKSISDLKYVYDALKPAASESEATAMFTRLIEASLSSSFTKINFFIHNLAQLRFSGSESENKKTLSFCSKIHTLQEDGVIVEATVVGYHKKYNPDKCYMFCIRLKREMRSGKSYIYRTFSEFSELHQKLSLNFPSSKLPSFPSKVIVGRSQIKQVAERRKIQLNAYLQALLHVSLDVSKSPLIYTFFHPLLRDEQAETKSTISVARAVPRNVSGEVKLSIHHKNNALFIMVMHCRNLLSPDGDDPDPYVKTYLNPDPNRTTKRKTKVARKTLHPTYNEMLIYDIPLDDVQKRHLQVSVWNYEQLNENDFLGSVTINLEKLDLREDNVAWHPLTSSMLTSR